MSAPDILEDLFQSVSPTVPSWITHGSGQRPGKELPCNSSNPWFHQTAELPILPGTETPLRWGIVLQFVNLMFTHWDHAPAHKTSLLLLILKSVSTSHKHGAEGLAAGDTESRNLPSLLLPPARHFTRRRYCRRELCTLSAWFRTLKCVAWGRITVILWECCQARRQMIPCHHPLFPFTLRYIGCRILCPFLGFTSTCPGSHARIPNDLLSSHDRAFWFAPLLHKHGVGFPYPL